jgi:hypothetical protein
MPSSRKEVKPPPEEGVGLRPGASVQAIIHNLKGESPGWRSVYNTIWHVCKMILRSTYPWRDPRASLRTMDRETLLGTALGSRFGFALPSKIPKI